MELLFIHEMQKGHVSPVGISDTTLQLFALAFVFALLIKVFYLLMGSLYLPVDLGFLL